MLHAFALDSTSLLFGAFAAVQLFAALAVYQYVRSIAKEHHLLTRELFGALKKIEGYTAHRREQMVRHYDEMLVKLQQEVPRTISERTSDLVFDTERRILTRLAELEPNLKGDAESLEKMDSLIQSMERLEASVSLAAADAANAVLGEGRKILLTEQEEVGTMWLEESPTTEKRF